MGGYWVRHRLLFSVIICVAVALIASILFVYPSILRGAQDYNAQSIYKNTKIDFIAPEPSFDQISDLPGTNGINEVFPFFLTKTPVRVKEKTRTSTVLLSDQFQNIGFTMYNDARLIEKSSVEYENQLLVDWQFCKDTSAGIGDSVFFPIGGKETEYKIFAIYETNSIYDGGAVIARISSDQKNFISQQSMNNGYSGMYLSASDYNACRGFLTTDYRPLGRLKDRERFSSDEQYQVHYDAIMSSAYANEITDFRMREKSLVSSNDSLLCFIGALLAAVLLIAFNVTMSQRGCEKVFFTKQCLPRGQSIKPFYRIAFAFELLTSILLYIAFLFIRIKTSRTFIPMSSIRMSAMTVPAAIVVSEIICFYRNSSMVSGMVRKNELEKQHAKEPSTHDNVAASDVEDGERARWSVGDEHPK